MRIPLLLIHGTYDYTVPSVHTERMAAALKKAGKQYELVMIPRADHYYGWRSQRVTLLTALEKFLATNLGASPH